MQIVWQQLELWNKEIFIAYVGSPDVHDASVKSVFRLDDSIKVELESQTRRRFRVLFAGIKTLVSDQPEGMSLYSISEMCSDTPYRKFVFVNSREDDPARLEIEARDMRMVS